MNAPVWFPQRCQSNEAGNQCALMEGHFGPHLSDYQLTLMHERNQRPTLDDIRRVVREEIRDELRAILLAAERAAPPDTNAGANRVRVQEGGE